MKWKRERDLVIVAAPNIINHIFLAAIFSYGLVSEAVKKKGLKKMENEILSWGFLSHTQRISAFTIAIKFTK
jgi:hypothetical protein